ncbi:hypothetical protein ACHAXS_001524 [Conticribra weissflogii]
MVVLDQLPIYAHSIRQSFVNSVLYESSQTCLIASLDTNSLQNLTYQFSITHLNWMNQAKSSVLLSCPFGKYKYKHLPMGLKCAPDFAQQVMEEVLRDVDNTGIYLDNIGAFSFTWEHHMLLLDKILHWLEANSFPLNPLKSKWAIQETDCLGYWLTPTGLKPWHK